MLKSLELTRRFLARKLVVAAFWLAIEIFIVVGRGLQITAGIHIFRHMVLCGSMRLASDC
jgi:hypothetical protein